jgi:hypothetical protein
LTKETPHGTIQRRAFSDPRYAQEAAMTPALADERDQVLREEWSESRERSAVLSTAELAECNCPEFCERDHDRD